MRKNARIRTMLRNLRRPIEAVQRHTLPTRRLVLTALVRLPLIGGLALSGRRVSAARRSPRGKSHTALTIAAVVDHMLPGGELPGAQTLGIARRIASTPDPDLKRSFARGVAWLDARARKNGGSNFIALDQAGKEAVLQAALASHADGVGDFVRELRNLAFTHYYTHPTIMAAFAYSGPPQPAGFPDFQEAPR
jgi:Gluconate 2-dehydrogenase subunit 3